MAVNPVKERTHKAFRGFAGTEVGLLLAKAGVSKAEMEAAEAEYSAKGFDLSASPQILALQLRCLALARRKRQEIAGVKAASPTPIKPEPPVDPKAVLIAGVKAVSKRLAPNSPFENACLFGPGAIDTDISLYIQADFPDTGKQGLLLLGATGCGKTYAAIAYTAAQVYYAEQERRHRVSARYVRAYDLARMVNKRQDNDLDTILGARFLIIDELGMEGSGFYGQDFITWLTSAIDTRWARSKAEPRPTFLASNLTMEGKDGFLARYGDRTVSRLSEMCAIYQSTGPDLRMQKQEAPHA